MGQQPRQGLIIVCDSAPLFALAVCGQLHLLEKIYDEVLIRASPMLIKLLNGRRAKLLK
jgi:predicted nucleic acid-binding protein